MKVLETSSKGSADEMEKLESIFGGKAFAVCRSKTFVIV